jgi:nitrogen-specific signal transduction histidine kinase
MAQEPAKKPADPQEQEAIMLMVKVIGLEMEARLYALAPEQNKDKADAANKLTELYSQIARNPIASRHLVSSMLRDYTSVREGARGAAQVSQVADEAGIKFQMLVIAQNQRIIELLEQIARKRP